MPTDERNRLLGTSLLVAMALAHPSVAVGYYLATSGWAGVPAIGTLAVPGLFAVLMLLAARKVVTADLSGDRCLQVAGTALVVGVGFGTVTYLVVATQHLQAGTDLFVLLNDVAFGGAVAGTGIGFYQAKHDRERAALAERTEQLQVANQLLRHDIRNDATVVYAYAELLREDYGDHEAVDQIIEKTDHIVGLTQAARDAIDTPDDATFDRSTVDVGDTLRKSLEQVRVDFPGATISVANGLPTGIGVRANHLLEAVFTNLLRNAVQHNEGDPHVELSTDVTTEHVVVRVSDDGPGLPDDAEELFEPGVTSDDGTHSGLGLHLVQRLVDQYGGSVSVEENEPRGTTFVVELPRA